jgi:hypothetical protein
MRSPRVGAGAGFLALALAAIATSAQGQGRTVGLKGGITVASADLGDLEETFDAENRTGWGIGAFLTWGGGWLSIQPELNVVDLGFEAVSPFASPEVQLTYIAPAALVKLGIPAGVVKPSLFGGVGVGIELRCRIEGVDCEDSPFPLNTEASDPTGIFGADLDIYPSPTLALRLDIRYAIGFDDIRQASDIWSEIKNRAWQFSGGVGFRF